MKQHLKMNENKWSSDASLFTTVFFNSSRVQSRESTLNFSGHALRTSAALNFPRLHLEYYSIKAIMSTLWRMQTRTSSHEEDNIARHLIYYRWQPHALFVLSKLLYIFCVKVTHCQSSVCPAHLWLCIWRIRDWNLWLMSLTSSLCAPETREEK